MPAIKPTFFNTTCFEKIKKYRETISSKKLTIPHMAHESTLILLINAFVHVTVRSTPSENGTSLFILHEGHKVNIKDDSMKDWKEIRLEDGKVGWVPVGSIEII